MHAPETPCTDIEERLSAFLDGELPAGAAADALEHAFACASCRRFFVAARNLQRLAPELAEPAPVIALENDPAWAAIHARSGLGRRRARRLLAPARPWLRAAALVALGLGGGYILAAGGRPVTAPVAPAAAAPAATLIATGSGAPSVAGMDERRFVALAQELLAADRKYQRTMLQVLRLVPALETGEGLDRPEDSQGFVRAGLREEARERGTV